MLDTQTIACIIIICWVLKYITNPIYNYIKYYQKKNDSNNVTNNESNNVTNNESNNVTNDNIYILKKNTNSCSDMSILHNPVNIDKHEYSSIMPIQKISNECFRCSQKLYNYRNKVDYFAYDRQLCEVCWHKATRSINIQS